MSFAVVSSILNVGRKVGPAKASAAAASAPHSRISSDQSASDPAADRYTSSPPPFANNAEKEKHFLATHPTAVVHFGNDFLVVETKNPKRRKKKKEFFSSSSSSFWSQIRIGSINCHEGGGGGRGRCGCKFARVGARSIPAESARARPTNSREGERGGAVDIDGDALDPTRRCRNRVAFCVVRGKEESFVRLSRCSADGDVVKRSNEIIQEPKHLIDLDASNVRFPDEELAVKENFPPLGRLLFLTTTTSIGAHRHILTAAASSPVDQRI